MNPLMFVNWKSVSDAFTGMAWVAVLIMVVVCFACAIPSHPTKAQRCGARACIAHR